MTLKKYKDPLFNIVAKSRNKLLGLPILSLEVPLLSLVLLGLILLANPMLTHAPIHNKTKITEVKSTSHVVSTPTVVKPAVIVPAVATPTVDPHPSPQPTKVVTQAGTSKSEPVVTASPSSNVSGLAPTTSPSTQSSTPPTTTQTPSTQTTTGYTSTNWSGYLATDASFIGISASWTATDPAGSGSTNSADSTWIGIGGVTSRDLIQVGTQNTVTSAGQISSSAFYEMLPNVSQPVPGVNVSPGDSITASISEAGSEDWAISITDTTDNESVTFTVSYDSSLSSAEWIEEDPSYSFGRQIPFDNFGEAIFTDASVVANGTTLTISSSTAQPVTMVNNSDQTIAVPSALGANGNSFTISP